MRWHSGCGARNRAGERWGRAAVSREHPPATAIGSWAGVSAAAARRVTRDTTAGPVAGPAVVRTGVLGAATVGGTGRGPVGVRAGPPGLEGVSAVRGDRRTRRHPRMTPSPMGVGGHLAPVPYRCCLPGTL